MEIRIRYRRMEGAEESTEQWWPQTTRIVFTFLISGIPFLNITHRYQNEDTESVVQLLSLQIQNPSM